MKLEYDKKPREIIYQLENIIVKLAQLRYKRINNLNSDAEYLFSEELICLNQEIRELDLVYDDLKEQKNNLLHKYDVILEGNYITKGGIIEHHRTLHTFYTSIDCKITTANQFYWEQPNYRDLFIEIHERYGFDYENENVTVTDIRQIR